VQSAEIIRKRFSRQFSSYDDYAVVQRLMAEKLVGQIPVDGVPCNASVLEVGCGTGFVTQRLAKRIQIGSYVGIDIIAEAEQTVLRVFEDMCNARFFQIDAADIGTLSVTPDLFVSGATIQWIADLHSFFQQLSEMMPAGGIVAFSTFGADNFREIRAVEGIALQYLGLDRTASLLSANFDVLHAEETTEVLYFPSGYAVLKHIQQSGVNSVVAKRWTRKNLSEFEHAYAQQFACPQGLSLTYNPQYFIAKKR